MAGGTKSDMERVGIFKEMEYISIGDKYVPGGAIAFNSAAGKGKQLLPGGSKERSAKTDGYFTDKFSRILEGESYSDPIKTRRQFRIQEGKKNIGKPFLPSNGEKKPSGLGNHYGTLGGPIEYFKPNAKPYESTKGEKRNVVTNPGKLGTGFGYSSVTINKFPEYKTDSYGRAAELFKKEVETHKKSVKGSAFKLNMHPRSYFDDNPFKSDKGQSGTRKESNIKRDVKPFKPSSPAKKPGNMHAGTFTNYPSHSEDKYKIVKFGRPVDVRNKHGKVFVPSQGPKSTPVNSVVNQNVIRSINAQNYKTLSSVMSY